MSSFIEEFTEAMRAAGLDPQGEIIADGKRHRIDLAGDKRHSRNGWYILYSDYPQSGSFGSWRLGIKEKWTTRSRKQLSAEQREAQRRMIEEQRAQRERLERDAKAKAAAKAQALWARAPLATEDHPYLVRKGIKPFGVKQYRGAIVVPCRSAKGELLSLQFISAAGEKRFLTGGEIAGCYCTIGKPADKILICEGYATGVTLHLATGHAVVVAFNAGNLLSVAKAIRAKFPEREIIICADNDAWTKLPDGRSNPGQVFALLAASAIKALYCCPKFKDTDSKPSDFNDLAGQEGLTVVAKQVDAAFDPELLAKPSQQEEEPPHFADEQLGSSYENSPSAEEPDLDQDNAPEPEQEMPFLALGYSKGPIYHFLSSGTQQVSDFSPTQLMNKGNLLNLAELSWWMDNFPKRSRQDGLSVDWVAAANALMKACHKMKSYDPNRIRGRGSWWDNGRVALHLGDKVLLENRAYELRKAPTKYIYESGSSIIADTSNPLRNSESIKFMELMSMLSWERPIYARYAAGWCVCAHIGGVLKWRPHIWVVGSRGSGKSYLMSSIIRPILGENCIFVVSESSEAGIRQTLGHDSLPVLFDEAEGENQKSHERLQRVLGLVRQSSSETGAKIMKGTTSGKSISFSVRSCFAFSSINANIVQQSDRSRVSVLELSQENRLVSFDDIKKVEADVFTGDYGQRFYARALKLAPVIRANADMFARVVAAELGEQRAGDQIGTLLAGAYALHSQKAISIEAASKWVQEQDWSEAKEDVAGQSDERLLWARLMQSKIDVDTSRGRHPLPIGELVDCALTRIEIANPRVEPDDANATLQRSGLKTIGSDSVAVANKHPVIEKLLKDTPWAVNWGRILKRLPDSKSSVGTMHFPGGVGSMKAVIVKI